MASQAMGCVGVLRPLAAAHTSSAAPAGTRRQAASSSGVVCGASCFMATMEVPQKKKGDTSSAASSAAPSRPAAGGQGPRRGEWASRQPAGQPESDSCPCPGSAGPRRHTGTHACFLLTGILLLRAVGRRRCQCCLLSSRGHVRRQLVVRNDACRLAASAKALEVRLRPRIQQLPRHCCRVCRLLLLLLQGVRLLLRARTCGVAAPPAGGGGGGGVGGQQLRASAARRARQLRPAQRTAQHGGRAACWQR